MLGQEVPQDADRPLPHDPGLVLESTLYLSEEDSEEKVFAAELV